MNCAQCKELLVAYFEGLLDGSQKQAVAEHLEQCHFCQAQANDVVHLRKRLIKNGKVLARSDLEDQVVNRVIREQNARLKKAAQAAKRVEVWKTIVKHRVSRYAAAAAIIVGIIVGMYFLGSPLSTTMTFAEVVRPILTARTAELDIILGEEGSSPVIHDMVRGTVIRRTFSNMKGIVSIIDVEQGRILTLGEAGKEAVSIDLEGWPPMPNYMDMLRNIITDLRESPDFVVRELGQRELQGRQLVGFHAEDPKAELTVWADPATALPVRVEHTGGQMTVIYKNFKFNVPMDETLFSMDVPQGYTLQETAIDVYGATEADFIEGLRIRAELLGDGLFPDSVVMETYLKQAPMISRKINRLGVSEQEEMELQMKLTRHLMFIRFFKGEGRWHYGGRGVEIGDADTAIFWYRPVGSETYRVIYGDLRVENVAPESLPAEEPAAMWLVDEQQSQPDFVGAQKDLWHVKESGDVAVRSDITLRKWPQDAAVMRVNLPYAGGELKSVAVGDTFVRFRQVDEGQYECKLPLEILSASQIEMQCRWVVSLDALEEAEGDYRAAMQSLVPVVNYRATLVLQPGCGFEFVEDSDQGWQVLFSWNGTRPRTHFGSRGMGIQRSG
jgi:hypothetical protein